MIEKCPKCGSKPVKPLPGATIFRCSKCARAWTSWQQTEIERLQKEIERLTESAFSMAQRADHKIANLRGLLKRLQYYKDAKGEIYGHITFNLKTRKISTREHKPGVVCRGNCVICGRPECERCKPGCELAAALGGKE